MQRRKFIQQIAWLAGGLLVAGQLPALALKGKGKKVKGRVLSKGKGIGGVVISDGYSVVATGKNGRYELEPNPAAVAIFISTPAGYEFRNENGISRHYYATGKADPGNNPDFELTPLDRDDNEHQFIIWADPQVKDAADVQKMMTQSVPDVQKFVADAGSDTLLHGITVGDIVWDELQLFAEYNKAVALMGIPFFQCLGNHDMDFTGGDNDSDNTFQETYGPTYYSFNRGKAHYVVLDDVRYLGKDRGYDGYISERQLDWLRKDLAFVPQENLVIICLHIPVHSGVKNNTVLYDIIKGRNVHIMSGHTHYNENAIQDGIYEHNHGTVCGAWWTGPICCDGAPCGYGIYQVKGRELSWRYQSTGEAADHQFSIFVNDQDAAQKLVQVNIWNYDPAWKTAYAIDGVDKGALEQFEGFDPQAYTTLLGPDLPNSSRGFAEPKKMNHLFKALVPSPAKEISITVTDRFEKKYSSLHQLTA